MLDFYNEPDPVAKAGSPGSGTSKLKLFIGD